MVYVVRRRVQRPILPAQGEFLAHRDAANGLFLGGRGAGKSAAGAIWVGQECSRFPGLTVLATGNSYRQCDDVVVPALIWAFELLHLPYEWQASKARFVVHAKRGRPSFVLVRSTETYQRLRGLNADRWWCDEMRDASRGAIDVLLATLRGSATPKPLARFTTTPSGTGGVPYHYFRRKKLPEAFEVLAPTATNFMIPPTMLMTLRAVYGGAFQDQELDAKWVDMDGSGAYTFNRQRQCRKLDPVTPGLELMTFWDFNVTPLAVIVAQERAGEVHCLGELALRDASIPEACRWLGSTFGTHPGMVAVLGDATGRGRTAQTGESSYQIIMKNLAPVFGTRAYLDVPDGQPGVRDRVDSVNYACSNEHGTSALYVDDEACPELATDLEEVRWDKKGGLDKSDPERTHHSDALGYGMHRRYRPTSFVRANRSHLEDIPY